jgi:hypothetical protein
MYQKLWGYKVEEKLYLGVREQKRLNTTALEPTHIWVGQDPTDVKTYFTLLLKPKLKRPPCRRIFILQQTCNGTILNFILAAVRT